MNALRAALDRLGAAGVVSLGVLLFCAFFHYSAVRPLERVYAVARESGLAIQQGEYRLESRGSGLLSYRLTFPVRGTYGQIRQFVGTTLKDLPIASIDALRFERRRVGDTQLEGQVRLSIYFRREGDHEIAVSAPSRESAPLARPRDTAPSPRDSQAPAFSSPPPATPTREEPEL